MPSFKKLNNMLQWLLTPKEEWHIESGEVEEVFYWFVGFIVVCWEKIVGKTQ